MNPKICIAVDAKNRAVATVTGMATVGAKVDVEITGLPTPIPDWTETDKWNGRSVRFRVVNDAGQDLVRFPLVEKTGASANDGDKWTVTGTSPNETYKTNDGTETTPEVDFDTDGLRKAFRGVPFNEFLEFGVIIDSIVDAAQYAVGKIRIRQWASASTEDPTVLPDWRDTLEKLTSDLAAVEASKTAATAAATAAASARDAAQASQSSASNSSNAAAGYASAAAGHASDAAEQKQLAQAARSGAEAARIAADVAVSHYPKIGQNGNWFVWDTVRGEYSDTGYAANGGHNIFKGRVFERPSNAKGWYELLAYVLTEMGGNIATDGIVPGTAPTQITMTANDGASKSVRVVKVANEYTTEVV